MFETKVVVKVVLSIVGLALYTFSTAYTANPNASGIAYVAAISGAVGGYLVGLFQEKPQA